MSLGDVSGEGDDRTDVGVVEEVVAGRLEPDPVAGLVLHPVLDADGFAAHHRLDASDDGGLVLLMDAREDVGSGAPRRPGAPELPGSPTPPADPSPPPRSHHHSRRPPP